MAVQVINTWSGVLDLWSLYSQTPSRWHNGAETSTGDTYHELCCM